MPGVTPRSGHTEYVFYVALDGRGDRITLVDELEKVGITDPVSVTGGQVAYIGGTVTQFAAFADAVCKIAKDHSLRRIKICCLQIYFLQILKNQK